MLSDDLTHFNSLARSAVRVLELQDRLGLPDGRAVILAEFFDRSADAILFLDRLGRIAFANAAAERLAGVGDGVRITPDGIVFDRTAEQTRFERAFTLAMSLSAMPQAFLAGRPSGKADYVVHVTPLGMEALYHDPAGPRAAIQILDPSHITAAREDLLQSVYGLTAAEVRLARALLRGRPLPATARDLGIAYSTARSHLATIFAKMGVRRQADLLRLLDRLV